jgi:hypothetical protein
MPELALDRKERLARLVRGLDTTICVAIFIAASMPAIVIMLVIAFPLLPLFGVWVSWVATTGGPTLTGAPEHSTEEEHKHPPSEHAGAAPRYA